MFDWLKKKIMYRVIDKEVKKLADKTPRSWRTTLTGLGGFLTVLGATLQAVFDGDPATNVNWSITLPALLTSAGLIFARDQKAHDLGNGKDQSKRSSALTGVFILVCLLGASQAQAQDYSVELGASAYGTSRFAGHACLIRSLTEATASISCAEARGNGEGQPVYTTATGIGQLLQTFDRFKIYGLAQAGTAVSESAVSGLFNGGFCVGVQLRPDTEVMGCGQGIKAPTIGPWEPLVTLGVRYKFPSQP